MIIHLSKLLLVRFINLIPMQFSTSHYISPSVFQLQLQGNKSISRDITKDVRYDCYEINCETIEFMVYRIDQRKFISSQSLNLGGRRYPQGISKPHSRPFLDVILPYLLLSSSPSCSFHCPLQNCPLRCGHTI